MPPIPPILPIGIGRPPMPPPEPAPRLSMSALVCPRFHRTEASMPN